MSKSQNSFIKFQKEKKRRMKKQQKEERKQERKENSKGGDLDDMIAYVDEFGNLTTQKPVEKKDPEDEDQ